MSTCRCCSLGDSVIRPVMLSKSLVNPGSTSSIPPVSSSSSSVFLVLLYHARGRHHHPREGHPRHCRIVVDERSRRGNPTQGTAKLLPDRHICTVARDMLSNASRQASVDGHLSTKSPRTEFAARIVKSTSSIDSRDRTRGEYQIA
jgi:hypothetical protein